MSNNQMQSMLLTILFNSWLVKLRAGEHDEVISNIEKAVVTLSEDKQENGE